MTAPVGVTTRTQRARLHWLVRAAVLGGVAGAASLPFWAHLAGPLARFEFIYWSAPAPLSPAKWALQGRALDWALAQPIGFKTWLLTMLTGAAVSLGVYLWETWASRPMDSAKQLNNDGKE